MQSYKNIIIASWCDRLLHLFLLLVTQHTVQKECCWVINSMQGTKRRINTKHVWQEETLPTGGIQSDTALQAVCRVKETWRAQMNFMKHWSNVLYFPHISVCLIHIMFIWAWALLVLTSTCCWVCLYVSRVWYTKPDCSVWVVPTLMVNCRLKASLCRYNQELMSV